MEKFTYLVLMFSIISKSTSFLLKLDLQCKLPNFIHVSNTSEAELLLNSKTEFHQAPMRRMVTTAGLQALQGEAEGWVPVRAARRAGGTARGATMPGPPGRILSFSPSSPCLGWRGAFRKRMSYLKLPSCKIFPP